jgi:hypothetical protein
MISRSSASGELWAPVGRMGFLQVAVVDHRQHGAAQCFCTAEFLVARGGTTALVISFTVAAESTDQCDRDIGTQKNWFCMEARGSEVLSKP